MNAAFLLAAKSALRKIQAEKFEKNIGEKMEKFNNLNNLTPEQIDLFKEISNIGAGNAATAMSEILNKNINIDLPNIKILPFSQVAGILNGPESVVIGVLVNISGDLNGYMLFVQELPYAATILSVLLGKEIELESESDFSQLELSALGEVANILIGAYLSAISSMTGLAITPSVPYLTIDMAGAILSVPTIEYGAIGDAVLLMETALSDEEKKVGIHFFLIPDLQSYDVLMKSLGVCD